MRIAAGFFSLLVLVTGSPAIAEPAEDTAPVKHIGVYVLPYYQSAPTLEGRPTVAVAKAFDVQLGSNKREDILAVRDAIEAQPETATPMTLMVLAIRLYDVGLRDDSVFWFYAAKDRYFTLADVLNVKSPSLTQVDDAIRNFVTLAGPFINSYAFCDVAKEREASLKAITWVEKHPYEALFVQQLPALPGDRAENLKKSVESIKARNLKEQQVFDDPKYLEAFNEKRKEKHVEQQFCWGR